MLNEGSITNDAGSLVRSEMVRQLQKLGETTPEAWERATFEAITGGSRDDVDWEIVDNHAGYYLWVKGFDGLVQELIDDGYAVLGTIEGSNQKCIRPGEAGEDCGEWSQMVYPQKPEA